MIIVINTEPVSEKHICWYTVADSYDNIQLVEVVERFYVHPQAPDDAYIQQTEVISRNRASRLSSEAAAWILLEANQKAISFSVKHKALADKAAMEKAGTNEDL
jgi:hypothetical protein